MTDDSIIRLYTQELIDISEQARTPQTLANPAVSATAVSPICGSTVTVQLILEDGKIAGFGYDSESCALTRTVLAVISRSIIGKTRTEVRDAGEAFRRMLQENAAPPAGDWAGLALLQSVRDYPQRHNATLLPFEAVEKAFALLA
jgi:NifU-like protein involved in Fe-S cluster formation